MKNVIFVLTHFFSLIDSVKSQSEQCPQTILLSDDKLRRENRGDDKNVDMHISVTFDYYHMLTAISSSDWDTVHTFSPPVRLRKGHPALLVKAVQGVCSLRERLQIVPRAEKSSTFSSSIYSIYIFIFFTVNFLLRDSGMNLIYYEDMAIKGGSLHS